MLFRETIERFEEQTLSAYASHSKNTKGRGREEEKCKIRTEYQRDRDRILHSKAFRRLKHKTQVFLSPEGDHYRTRLTHTLEVSQISRTIARTLRYNEDLTEAIALGHDLGHTPFGHGGEKALDKIHPGGFKHNEQSLRVVQELEMGRTGYGLNLTYEVEDGILNHTGERSPETIEGKIVRISDRIAYINHDIDDAIRAGVLCYNDLPTECLKILGRTHGERINNMILDIVKNSHDKDSIRMSDKIHFYTEKLRDFMFENVYLNKYAKKEEEKVQRTISQLYSCFLCNPEKITDGMEKRISEHGINEVVKDYIAGMTDRYVIQKYLEIYVPENWK